VAHPNVRRRTIGRTAGNGSVVLHIVVAGRRRPASDPARRIYRIACDALRNAFKQRQRDPIEVELRYDERQLRLRVRDDGKGIDTPRFPIEERRRTTTVLHGMRKARQADGGTLTVWMRWTPVRVELSVPAPALRDLLPQRAFPGSPGNFFPREGVQASHDHKRRSIRILSVDIIRSSAHAGIAGLVAIQSDIHSGRGAANGREAIPQFLLTIRMSRADGFTDAARDEAADAIIAIRGEFAEAALRRADHYAGDVQVLRSLKAVARRTFENTLHKELVETIRCVHACKKSRSPSLVSSLPSMPPTIRYPAGDARLALIAEAMQQEIASLLSVS